MSGITGPLSRRLQRAALLCTIVALPAWAGGSYSAFAPERQLRDKTTWDSIFTADQAGRGETTYKQLCARCHMDNLAGADEAVELTGSAFLSAWNGQTLADLHERIRTSMPTDTPGVYGRQEVTDVMAYVLRFNGFPAGNTPLTHENDALTGIRFVSARP